MGIFLNSTAPFEAYKITALDKYFVDKTMLIEELIPSIGREQRFLCITRPRRFGKTVMANMVASYFGKAIDSSFVFEHLAIAKSPVYEEYINKYDVSILISAGFQRIAKLMKNILIESKQE